MPPKSKRKLILASHIKRHPLEELTANCATCIQFSKQQPKEALCPHSVPSFPWQKLGCDLLDYQGAQYLLVADYYNKYPILRKLNPTTSAAIINHLKAIFAEHVIPESLVTDNGPQYSSPEFTAFCDHWGINHITSSPLYPKSNGFIERMVQTVKNLLKKSDAAGQDPYLALLSYQTTPIDSNLPSPAIGSKPKRLSHTTTLKWTTTALSNHGHMAGSMLCGYLVLVWGILVVPLFAIKVSWQ